MRRHVAIREHEGCEGRTTLVYVRGIGVAGEHPSAAGTGTLHVPPRFVVAEPYGAVLCAVLDGTDD